jgi:ParB/RepB/Spo0J family partition protein
MSEVAFLRVPIGQLVPNPWNPNEMDPEVYEKARQSIRQFGFIDPITVRQLPDGMYQIIDGEHRWRAAKDEGLDDVPIIVIDVSDADAEQLTFILNELRGKPNPQKLANLIRDLAAKRPMSELEAVLPLRRQQLAAMVAERRDAIDWNSLQAKPEPEKKERWVERVFRLPKSAADVVDEALAKVREDGVEDDWKALELICADFISGA